MTTGRKITRRALLRAAAAVPLAPIVAGLSGCGPKDPVAAGGDRGRVVIVGGGLCGLVVLDRLRKAGREAILLEAGDRLGGRIWTERDRLPAGLRAEMGAERVGAAHAGVKGLLDELGLATVGYPDGAHMSLRWRGRDFEFGHDRELPAEVFEGLSDVERAAGPFDVAEALVKSAPAPLVEDKRSGIEWLRANGLTARGEDLVRAFGAIPLDSMPAAVMCRTILRDEAAARSELVAGGTDRIVEALAARNAASIMKGVAVASLRQDARGVTVADEKGGRFDGAHAVMCLPLSRISKLDVEGGTRDVLAARLGALQLAHETKVATLMDQRWRSGHPDWPEYRFAERNVSWRLPEKGPAGEFVEQSLRWEHDCGRPKEPFLSMGSRCHDFAFDPLIGGAYAFSKSGTAPEGIVRAGRLIFAGADLSDRPGWMEGAVRAAEQAVAALTS